MELIEIHFRKAMLNDADLLLRWRNDEGSRKNSNNSAPVLPERHLKWLLQTLADPNRILLIAEHENVPVGTIRFDRLAPETWEMSWTVAPEFRGRGIGKALVGNGTSFVAGEIQAVVKDHNLASIRIAEEAGFKKISHRDGCLVFSLRR